MVRNLVQCFPENAVMLTNMQNGAYICTHPIPQAAQAPQVLITLATKDTEETLRDPQSCAPGRFENFLRDGCQHGVMYHGKGLDFVATASFKA